MVASAAAFIKSRARRSLGFWKPCLFANLTGMVNNGYSMDHVRFLSSYLWKPRPSTRTTMKVLGSKVERSSNSLTYSYLEFAMDGGVFGDSVLS